MIKLSFVGDISLGEHYFSFGHGPRSLIENGNEIFSSVTEQLSKSDFVFGNLEGPISDIGYNANSPHSRVFRGSPESVNHLKYAGFNVLTIANNHSIQHGEAAIKESIKLLEEAGIVVVGLRSKPITHIPTIDGNIAVIACSLIPDNTDKDQEIYFAPNELELVQTVCVATQNGTPTLVYIHWGIEGTASASQAQKDLAKKLLDAGATMVIGHHTHTLQPVLVSENSLIAFSLGNFVFDLPWSYANKESVILTTCLSNNKIHDTHYHRVQLEDNGKPNLTNELIRLAPGEHILSIGVQQPSANEAVTKLSFFLKNLLKGHTKVKLRFLAWKLLRKLA